MARARRSGGLGKGLEALIPTLPEPLVDVNDGSSTHMIAIEIIEVNPYQPRRVFDEEKIKELAESVREHGVLQPILVRRHEEGYQLVAGERRLRAAVQAGLSTIPALIKDFSEKEMMEVSLIENVQRENLDPVEEARAYRRLSSEFGLTQAQIAQRVSKSRPYIANSLRLLNLPEPVLASLEAGELTVGHVRPLLTMSAGDAIALALRLVQEGASVRQAEQWVRDFTESKNQLETDIAADDLLASKSKSKQVGGTKKALPLPSALKEIQRMIRERVNTKVEITQGSKGGKIIVDYYTQDDIERILELFTGSSEIS